MATPLTEFISANSAGEPGLTAAQTETLDAVIRVLGPRLEADPAVRWAVDDVVTDMREAVAFGGVTRPIQSPQVRGAVAAALGAVVEKRAAEHWRDHVAAAADLARGEAQRQLSFHERCPGPEWALDLRLCALRREESSQHPREVADGSLFLSKVAGENDLALAAEGQLHPWLQERIGSLAPAEYYRDVARLLVAHGDLARQLIERVCEDPGFREFLRPITYLARLLMRMSASPACEDDDR